MDLTISSILPSAIRRYHSRTALRVGSRTWTYLQLDQESDALATGLQSLGVQAGDRVAIFLRNSAEYLIADLALLKLGAVKIPLNEYQSMQDVVFILNDTKSSALIAHASLLNKLETDWSDKCDSPPLVCAANDSDEKLSIPHHAWDALTNQTDLVRQETHANSPAMIAYTGGTTGQPKGVVHTQQGLAINLSAHIVAGEISASDIMLLLTPLPHSAGYHMQACLLQGGMVILKDQFDAAEFFADVEKYRVTWTFMVPTMIYRLLDHPSQDMHDHSSLKTIVYGAAPMSTARLQNALELFGYAFIQLFGQTECPNFITALNKEDHRNESLHGSCGKAVPFVEVATRGELGTAIGEVIVRSPYLLKEYHNNAKATQQVLQDGWLQTGDIGYLDDQGYLFLKDRAKDMIISGGMNIYSTEVEQILKQHPSVVDAAVVGLPHDDWGELVHAFIVCSTPRTAEELQDHCRKSLSRYKIPKSIEFRSELPLTTYGKVDKKSLREAASVRHSEAAQNCVESASD